MAPNPDRVTEVCIVLLDVGPAMGALLPLARQAVAAFLTGKMVNKMPFQAQLFYFGTTGTSNMLHQEMMDADGDDTQYAHITEVKPLGFPEVSWLRALQHDEQGESGTPSDFFDAVTVAVDALHRAWSAEGRPELLKKTVAKRIVLVSNFLGESQPVDDDFMASVVDRLNQTDIKLDVKSLDIADADTAHADVKNANSDILARVLQDVRHSMHSVEDAAFVPTMFKTKETATTVTWSGALEIGDQMKMSVKMSKKTAQERLPSVGKWSQLAQEHTAPSHGVKLDREYRLERDPDLVVPEEERVKAYQYGAQTVVFPEELEDLLSFKAEKSVKLLGFARTDLPEEGPLSIQRHHYMKDVWAMVAAKEDERSRTAFSALVQALQRDPGAVMVVRFVFRENGAVQVCACRPLPSAAGRAPCLVLNTLPYQEDIRCFPFPAFSTSKHRPSKDQKRAAKALVSSLDLSGAADLLRPETIANPLLHRFYDFVRARALDPEAPLPPPGPVADLLRGPPLDKLPGAAAVLAALPAAFPITRKEDAEKDEEAEGGLLGDATAAASFDPTAEAGAGSAVEDVGTAMPKEDFQALLACSRADAAFGGVPQAVDSILASPNEGLHKKALAALQAMRRACSEREHFGRASAFNDYLRRLAAAATGSGPHRRFLAKMAGPGVQLTLLSSQEVPGSGASASDARAFLAAADPSQQAAKEAPEEPPPDDDDDFADME